MLYPIAIELGDDTHAFGVTVPDLPGCFSAGDTLDEAITNAREAIDLHLECLADDNEEIPTASKVQDLASDPQFAGYVWAVVDVELAQYLGKAEKINITLPGRLIKRIDKKVGELGKGANRSGFLAEAALEKLMQR